MFNDNHNNDDIFYPKRDYGNYNSDRNLQSNSITKKTLISVVIISLIVSTLMGISGGFLAYKFFKNASNGSSQGNLDLKMAETSDSSSNPSVSYTGEEMSIAQVAEFASSSVVEITTETVQRGSMMQQYIVQGAGSGVIISEDGYLITNNHVINNASKITVRLKNLDSYNATLIGTDSDMDVALLKIEATGLVPVVIGDSSALQVGQKCVAIGNPLGELGGTVTEGIISALDRNIMLNNMNMTLLQTDAAINPGNSGGGLFNIKGELIGLVVAKSSGEAVEGLGFAIPSNNVKPVVQDLSNYGYVKGKPYLGVSLIDINSMQSAIKNGVLQLGVYIAQVAENSGAQNAGLQKGDCILSIDSTPVSTAAEVQQIVKSHKVGDVINVEILRSNQKQTIPVTLGESVPLDSNAIS